MTMQFDTRRFDEATAQLAKASPKTAFEIVTLNARGLAKSLVYNTPRDTGATRAAFWPAYEALGMPGSPGTSRRMIPFQKKLKRRMSDAPGKVKLGKRRYVPEGKVIDLRKESGNPSFELIINTHYLTPDGRKVYYPYILDAQVHYWQSGYHEAAQKMERAYDVLLRKYSAS